MAGMRVRHWTPARAAPPVRPPSLLTHSLAPAFWPRPHKQICMDRGFAPTPIPNPLIGGVKRVSLGTLKQRAATATHNPLQALLAFRENILRNPCVARVCRSPAHFFCAVWRARALIKLYRGRARLPSTYDVLKCAAENIFNRDERFEFLDYALFGIGLKVVPLLQHTPPVARMWHVAHWRRVRNFVPPER